MGVPAVDRYTFIWCWFVAGGANHIRHLVRGVYHQRLNSRHAVVGHKRGVLVRLWSR
jgi:hypothetical protein